MGTEMYVTANRRAKMQTKLTLRMDADLIERAKGYARRTGKSVSQIVADYFALLERDLDDKAVDVTPIVGSLRGALKEVIVEEEEHRRELEERQL